MAEQEPVLWEFEQDNASDPADSSQKVKLMQ
jgi:hypothetical protein